MKRFFTILILSLLSTTSILRAGFDNPSQVAIEEVKETKTSSTQQKPAKIEKVKDKTSASLAISSPPTHPLNDNVEVIYLPEKVSHGVDIIKEEATGTLKDAIKMVQEEKEGVQKKKVSPYVYLTPQEAKQLLEPKLDELLEDHPDKETVKSLVFTEQFFGRDCENNRLESLWEACTEIFKELSERASLKTKEDFLDFILKNGNLDLFLGATPEEIKKAHQKDALFYKDFGGSYDCPLQKFLKASPIFSSDDEFYSLFGNQNLFFKDKTELERYWLGNDYGLISRTDIQELVSAAQKTLEMTQEGDTLLIFGNTPSLLGRILEKVAQGKREIINFPFSGAPNHARKGSHSDPASEDLTTENRWKYFIETYMPSKGLSPENTKLTDKTIWLFDLIVSGRGPAYLLEELLAKYHFREPRLSPPKINIVSLDEIHEPWEEQNNSENYGSRDIRVDKRFFDNIYKGDHRLYLPNKYDIRFTVPVVEMPLKCVDKLDSPKQHQRIFSAYNAMYWSSEYEAYRDRAETLYLKLFLRYFDLHVEKFLQQQAKVD